MANCIKRKDLSNNEKVHVIIACESERKISDICCEFSLVKSTVGTI